MGGWWGAWWGGSDTLCSGRTVALALSHSNAGSVAKSMLPGTCLSAWFHAELLTPFGYLPPVPQQ